MHAVAVQAFVVAFSLLSEARIASSTAWVTDASAPTAPQDEISWDYREQEALPAQFQQPLTPRVEASPALPQTAVDRRASSNFWSSFGLGESSPLTAQQAPPTDRSVISGQEAVIRATTDLGDLMGSSPGALNLGLQRRNPIINDPRVRGSRVGSLAASGSYWVPARIDLDTMVSKIDSQIVERVEVAPGPYAVLYGPGLQFVDFELLKAPRYGPDFEIHGSTNADYRTNGEQWYGRQTVMGGNDAWGFRLGYGHSTGSDYADGAGQLIPSSYKSRDVDAAWSAQLTPESDLSVNALRLDQTDVELAGQAFDLNWLWTNGFEAEYIVEDARWADQVRIETWYNETHFDGNAQNPSKREQFPYMNTIDFVGFTSVESLSTGYQHQADWLGIDGERLTAGTDLRYVKQELNEITSGRLFIFPWTDANSPLPRSNYTNPGVFAEASSAQDEAVQARTGVRLDYVRTHVLADEAELSDLGIQSKLTHIPLSAADIWGSDQLSKGDLAGLTFVSVDAALDDGWGAGVKIGYGERAPNLTERYVVESFMDLIQNGLNTVTGDPTLEKERSFQTDLTVSRQLSDFRCQATFFHAWVQDYITFEALSTAVGPPNGQIEQLNLKYVNTKLATLWGWEANAEYKLNELLSPFATLKYVQGEDLTRNGSFATHQAQNGQASYRTWGLPRGYYANTGVAPTGSEPLPGILPLESRIGLRWEERTQPIKWGLEAYSRIVDDQERVAASLLESTTPGFTVWNAAAFVKPTDRLTIVGGIDNITDKQYQEHLDFKSRNPDALSTFRSGISFYLGADLNY